MDKPARLTTPVRISLPYLAVVRSGETGVFRFLRHFEESDLARVIWDRRVTERRASRQPMGADRRCRERRSGLPTGWATLGVVVVPLRGPAAGQPRPGEIREDARTVTSEATSH